jgi:hypothetical protein
MKLALLPQISVALKAIVMTGAIGESSVVPEIGPELMIKNLTPRLSRRAIHSGKQRIHVQVAPGLVINRSSFRAHGLVIHRNLGQVAFTRNSSPPGSPKLVQNTIPRVVTPDKQSAKPRN